jgi:hypothetical protein
MRGCDPDVPAGLPWPWAGIVAAATVEHDRVTGGVMRR